VIEETCLFASSSARVDNRCKATLDEVALRMKDESDARALVIGYSDATGSEATNQKISERRAEAVKEYLVTRHGIDPSLITVEGRGEADPVGDNATAAGRAQNRRAVIRLTIGG
jgi:OOP family OmpA-OmpF porin